MIIKPKVFQEKMEYNKDFLSTQIGEKAIEELISESILKKNVNNDSGSQTEKYTFKYVGLIYLDQHENEEILLIYPKYIHWPKNDRMNDYKDIKKILKVINKSQVKKMEKNILSSQIEDLVIDKFSTIFNLIQNYFFDGIYYFKDTYLEKNGNGDTDWDSTIENYDALLINNTPFYLDTLTSVETTSDNYLVVLIHKAILQDIGLRYKEVLDFIGMNFDYFTEIELIDLGDPEYLLYLLSKELQIQYIDSKRNQLILMIDYLEQVLNKNFTIDMLTIGSLNFEHVWEDVCRVVLGDKLHETLDSLNLKSSKHLGNTELIKVISYPKWNLKEVDKSPSKGTLKPDIIYFEDDTMNIVDAKYYTFEVEELISHPKVEDISKQYLYQLAYADLIKENHIRIVKNYFVIPSESNSTKVIGDVSFDIFQNVSGGNNIPLQNIQIKKASANDYYDNYLEN